MFLLFRFIVLSLSFTYSYYIAYTSCTMIHDGISSNVIFNVAWK